MVAFHYSGQNSKPSIDNSRLRKGLQHNERGFPFLQSRVKHETSKFERIPSVMIANSYIFK